jgi:hypothetical protein
MTWQTPLVAGMTKGVEYSYDQGDHSKPRATLLGQVRDWPTASARDWKSGLSNQHGKNARPLNEVVVLVGLGLPAPASPSTNGSNPGLPTSDNIWPTPRVGRLDGGSNSRAAAVKRGVGKEATSRVLNGAWVLQLMGYPEDWCELPDSTIETLSKRRGTP